MEKRDWIARKARELEEYVDDPREAMILARLDYQEALECGLLGGRK